MNKRQKGFTLIELLVVIAIIGILSSVVLASLNTARGKGSDAAAESGLSSLQSQAAIYYNTNSTYAAATSTICGATSTPAASTLFADTQTHSIISNIYGNSTNITCNEGPSSFAVSVVLKSGAGSFCVDSNGNATTSTIQADSLCQ